MTFAWQRSRPTVGRPDPRTSADRMVADALQHRKPGAGGAPSRMCRSLSPTRGQSRGFLAELLPRVPPAFIAARARGDGHRTASGSPSGPVSLQRAGVLGRWFGPDARLRALVGFAPLQGSLATRRGAAIVDRPSPLGLRAPTAQCSGSLSRVAPWRMPLRVLPSWCLDTPPVRRGAGPHEVSHLLTSSRGSTGPRLWLPPWPCDVPFGPPSPRLPLELQVGVAASLREPSSGGPALSGSLGTPRARASR
jgi:hypothetical protein